MVTLYVQVSAVSVRENEVSGGALKGMGLSTPGSGGGGAAQDHPNQSSGARSTTATPLWGPGLSSRGRLREGAEAEEHVSGGSAWRSDVQRRAKR